MDSQQSQTIVQRLAAVSMACAALLLLAAATACARPEPQGRENGQASRLSTDLGLTGNARAARNFNTYRTATNASGCHAGGVRGRRILLTGFGPFNRKRNISGAVIDALQRADVWPQQNSFPVHGHFQSPDFEPNDDPTGLGASAVQRTLRYDGTEIDVCLLKVSVEWDFAAAVILHEAEKFQPQFILMSGYGVNPTGMRLEAGALNRTRTLSGFDPQGRALGELNSPLSQWIVPSELRLPNELAMDWKPASIAERNRERLLAVSVSIGRNEFDSTWKFVAMRSSDPQNDYICNNVSYAVLAALRAESIPLAGGKMILNPRFANPPAAAFVHYPFESDVTSVDEVWSWAHVLMSISGSVLDLRR